MLEDNDHDKVIYFSNRACEHLDRAREALQEVSHYITEDPEYVKAILAVVKARRQMERIVFISGISNLPEVDDHG